MPLDFEPPTVGGDTNQWGPKLNANLVAIKDFLNNLETKIDALTPNATAPIVGNVQAVSVTQSTATITWTAPSVLDSRGAPTGYNVGWGGWVGVYGPALSAPLTNFDDGNTYTVTVTPRFADGTTGAQNSVTFTTLGGTATPGDLPNGDAGFTFTGANYFQIADHADFYVRTTNTLSIEMWINLENINNPDYEQGSAGITHFFGKGNISGETTWNHEYVLRYYNAITNSSRPSSFSAYHFGWWDSTNDWLLGNGARIDTGTGGSVTAGTWMHLVATYNYNGNITIYKNGTRGATRQGLRAGYGTAVVPGPGGHGAPLRIGTRDFASSFNGKIAKVAMYNTELSEATVDSHYSLMTGPSGSTYDSVIEGTSGLVAYWPLDPGSPTTDASGSGHTLTYSPTGA